MKKKDGEKYDLMLFHSAAALGMVLTTFSSSLSEAAEKKEE